VAIVIPIVTSYRGKGTKAALRDIGAMQKQAKLAGAGITAGMLGAAGSMTKVGDKAMRMGRSLTLGATLPAALLGKVIWDVGSDYNLSMSQMQAASGATGRQMAKLDRIAKQMGTNSMFAAQDAAAAMLELSKSGMTAGQMAAGALKSTMLLAAAGELELGSAAESVANTLNMFSLKAGQANQVANALAGGANASSASVDSLRQALAQVGPGARNSGLSLQMTTGILAAFANKGIQGSDAGTSLKTMLTRLIPTTDKAAEAMARYGLNFTDARGRILPMTKVAQQLQDRLGGLTMKQRNAALATIFGSDATRAATVLMQEGQKGIKAYVKATSDRRAASKMAAAQENSDAGKTRKAMAAVKTAAIDIQAAMAPMVRWVAEGMAKIAAAFTRAPASVQKLAVALGVMVAAAGPVSYVFGVLAKGGAFALRTVSSLTMAFGEGAKSAPAWARGVASATRGIASFGKTVAVAVANLARQAAAYLADAAAKAASTAATVAHAAATKAAAAGQWLLNAAMSANPIGLIIIAIAALVGVFILLWKRCAWFRNFWIGLWDRIKAAAAAVWPTLKKVGQKIIQALADIWDKVSAAVEWFWGWAGPFIKGAAQQWWTSIKTVMKVIVAVVKVAWSAIKTAVSVAAKIIGGIIRGFRAFVGIVRSVWDTVKNATKAAWEWVSGAVRGAWERIKEAVSNGVSRVVEIVRGLGSKLKGILNLGSTLYEAGKDLVNGLKNGITAAWDLVTDKISSLVSSLSDAAKKALGINSPSRVFAEIGAGIGEGMALGISRSSFQVRAATLGLVDDTIARSSFRVRAATLALVDDTMGRAPARSPVAASAPQRGGAGARRPAATASSGGDSYYSLNGCLFAEDSDKVIAGMAQRGFKRVQRGRAATMGFKL
jgi:TP901 family phage tail tape measure protein